MPRHNPEAEVVRNHEIAVETDEIPSNPCGKSRALCEAAIGANDLAIYPSAIGASQK